jgi:hypothetical protein
MNKRQIWLRLFPVTFLFLLFFSCQNNILENNETSSSFNALSPETGFVRLSLTGENVSRAIKPETPNVNIFNGFILKFYNSNSGTITVNRVKSNLSYPINLGIGEYDLEILAYLDEGRTQLAAWGELKGNDRIIIAGGTGTSRLITLFAIDDIIIDNIDESGLQGTFMWEIFCNFNTIGVTAEMTIKRRNEALPVAERVLLDGTSTGVQTLKDSINDLYVGYYEVIFRFEKSGVKPIIVRDILYIYANLTSALVDFEITDDFFNNITYTVTFNLGYGQPSSYPVSSITHGDTSSILHIPTPERTGYVFDGWYTNTSYTHQWHPDGNCSLCNNIAIRDFSLYAKWLGKLEDAIITITSSHTYNTLAQTPIFTVTHDGRTLVRNTDYTVVVSNNINAGINTAIINIKAVEGSDYTGEKTANFTINKANPSYTVPVGLTANTGQTLAAISLPSGWTWVNPGNSVGLAGTRTHLATFTPIDTNNFNIITNISVTITVTIALKPLYINTGDLIYTNNHNNRNALTPILNGSYTERTATFTVEVSGFDNAADANNVGLNINPITGLSFSGHNITGNAIGGTKTFTVTVTLLDNTPFFSLTPSATIHITITGLTVNNASGVPSGYSYTGDITKAINIIDGMSSFNAIPVNQINILHFNGYTTNTTTRVAGLARHYRLTQNITLEIPTNMTPVRNWTAIGFWQGNSSFTVFAFTGSFDGQGYTITNLRVNGSARQGMFGIIRGGTVRNVGLINPVISGTNFVGGIAGTLSNDINTGQNAVIENCFIINTTGGSIGGWNQVGGIVGSMGSGTIRNCYVFANINAFSGGQTGDGDNSGGIVGEMIGGTIRNCVALSGIINYGVEGVVTERVGRITGVRSGTLINNYARNDMAGSVVFTLWNFFRDRTHDGKDGADVSATSPNGGFNSQDFWENTMLWTFGPTGVWVWHPATNLPRLRVTGQ